MAAAELTDRPQRLGFDDTTGLGSRVRAQIHLLSDRGGLKAREHLEAAVREARVFLVDAEVGPIRVPAGASGGWGGDVFITGKPRVSFSPADVYAAILPLIKGDPPDMGAQVIAWRTSATVADVTGVTSATEAAKDLARTAGEGLRKAADSLYERAEGTLTRVAVIMVALAVVALVGLYTWTRWTR